ncbi:hypothetical protein NDU88_002805 [Pleurodeles waltl]|uniref:Reverse transcriptase domain-containing protein n=1 Tax=Pleurodeles waltl TaxID=8319 RepID=A0AAV7PB25_PLEWA|nr:hypothetical protein NDU88_002805 [Pleurodeles waltl]
MNDRSDSTFVHGKCIVLLDTNKYKEKMQHMLAIPEHYSKGKANWETLTRCEIQQICHKVRIKGLICDQEYEYLNPQRTRTPVLYGVPKIHKSEVDPPFRPIVSTVGPITEPLSKYVEMFLKQRVVCLPAYVRDTGHIISKLEGIPFDPETQILVTMDIEALFTNIPQTQDLKAVAQIFGTESMTDHLDFVLQCLKIVLDQNYFMFDGDIYQQKK